MKRVKELLEHFHYPTEYLSDVVANHWEAKQWLAERLGLSEDNPRLTWPLVTGIDDIPVAKAFLLDITRLCPEYRILDLAMLYQGKNKVRVTKAIAKAWDVFCGLRDEDQDRHQGFIAMCRDAKTHEGDAVHKLQCYYGDLIKGDKQGMFTLDPYDFFTLSGYGCTWKSCVRMGKEGIYNNTCLHYLASDCVLPFFVLDKEGNKIGRCITYVSPELIATGRYYGSCFYSEALQARDKLQGLFGGKWIVKGHIAGKYINNITSSYIDYGYGVVTVTHDDANVTISTGMCLRCGDDVECNQGLVCDDCVGIVCNKCGNRFDEDDMCCVDETEIWCNDCVAEYAYTCDDCNTLVSKTTCVSGERYVCDGCLDNYSYCDGCNEYSDVGQMTSDGWRCDGCVSDNYSVCDHCGDVVPNDSTTQIEDKDEWWCEDCTNNDGYVCDECGLVFSKLNHEDNMKICDECLGDRDDEKIAENE